MQELLMSSLGIILIFIIFTTSVTGIIFLIGFLLWALFTRDKKTIKGWKNILNMLSEKTLILAILGALLLALAFGVYRSYQCWVNSINCSIGGGAPDYDYDPLHPLPQPQ